MKRRCGGRLGINYRVEKASTLLGERVQHRRKPDARHTKFPSPQGRRAGVRSYRREAARAPPREYDVFHAAEVGPILAREKQSVARIGWDLGAVW